MVYTEIKKKDDKKYFYRVKSVRNKGKVGKKRIYLGANLNKKELIEAEIKADRELIILSSLLKDKETKELEKIKKDYQALPKSTEENRYEAFVSQFTYDSTTIEGNTLTLQETAQLLFEGQTPRKSLREINEIINHKEAFDFILNYKKDIDRDFILKLHKLVVKETLKKELQDQIGKYRKVQVYIRGAKWLPPKSSELVNEMKGLLSWYSKNKKKLHPIILSAYFHSAFEAIHPFVDGNGRVGRLLLNFTLRKNNFPMINIPNERKFEYYDALERSHMEGDLRPLVKLLVDLLKKSKIIF